jgi:hypothetical protein
MFKVRATGEGEMTIEQVIEDLNWGNRASLASLESAKAKLKLTDELCNLVLKKWEYAADWKHAKPKMVELAQKIQTV